MKLVHLLLGCSVYTNSVHIHRHYFTNLALSPTSLSADKTGLNPIDNQRNVIVDRLALPETSVTWKEEVKRKSGSYIQ